MRKQIIRLVLLGAFTVLASCGDDDPPETFSVGGTVSGLNGTLVLENNGDALVLTDNAPFSFSDQVADGESYQVSVAISPYEQACLVTNGSGAVNGGDVSDISVVCRQRIVRASVHTDGTQGEECSASMSPSINSDGRYVAFRSDANNLVDGDSNQVDEPWVGTVNVTDVFVHDLQTGTTERVSIHTDGSQGDYHSGSPSISGDARYVAFESSATNLVDGDINAVADIFIHDRQTGATELVSLHTDGSQANNLSDGVSLSSDGRFVAFISAADTLVDNDTNGVRDVFVRDRQTGTTERISIHSNGGEGDGDSIHTPSISGDGRYVAFASMAENLVDNDTNGVWDVFVRDRQTGATERVSIHSNGSEGDGRSGNPSISDDGRYVAFASEASNLIENDTNSDFDIFVHDRQTGTTERISIHSDGSEGDGYSVYPSISDDGRYVAFDSEATNLIDNDTNGVEDIFVHDRETGTTERVSIHWDGIHEITQATTGPSISDDGRSVAFFSSDSNLVLGDTNADSCSQGLDVFIATR